MKNYLIILIILLSNGLVAQKSTQQDYVNLYHKLAQKEQLRTGVPAAITLAQGILESENGESALAIKSNNHFGIKCKSNWTGEKVYHNDDARGECFRKYETVEQSYMDHSDFLKNNERYAGLFQLEINDYQGWAKGLKAAGYATNPMYAEKLISLIEKLELYKFNDLSYSTQTAIVPITTTVATASSNIDVPTPKAIPNLPTKPEVVEEVTFVFNKPVEVNKTRAIYLPQGTSLLAVAIQHDIELQKLLEFNDLDKNTNDILQKPTLIYLQRKRKEGLQAKYTCKQTMTWHEVAQATGIRLESLQKMNTNLPKDKIPAGTILQTQSNSKK